MQFHIIRNDITKVKADVIVNTANPEVAVGGGVDAAIYKAAGKEQLLEARKKIGRLMPGEVAITDAFLLDAKYIVHVSGPRWNGGSKGEAECLRLCYDKALYMAKEHKCTSIVFPLLATGSYGFPKELGVKIATEAFIEFLENYEMDITLVVFEQDAVAVSGKLVDEVRSYVDDHYVDAAYEDEYQGERFRSSSDMMISASRMMNVHPHKSLEESLKSIYTDSFEKHLKSLINKKGLKNSEVYAAANISKQYFSKLLKGQVKPSKEKMLALAVGLHLNMDETIDFLQIAGYALSPISQTDVIVEYFITHEDYNVMKIDIVLFDYGLEPLSNS